MMSKLVGWGEFHEPQRHLFSSCSIRNKDHAEISFNKSFLFWYVALLCWGSCLTPTYRAIIPRRDRFTNVTPRAAYGVRSPVGPDERAKSPIDARNLP